MQLEMLDFSAVNGDAERGNDPTPQISSFVPFFHCWLIRGLFIQYILILSTCLFPDHSGEKKNCEEGPQDNDSHRMARACRRLKRLSILTLYKIFYYASPGCKNLIE